MCGIRSSTSSLSATASGAGLVTSRTTALRQPPLGAATRVGRLSVTLVPLLGPGVASVVVAVALPEPGLVLRHQRQARDPFGALPEVQVRHQQSDRTPVLGGQRPALVSPDPPRLLPT